jgi:hypothetical protein
VSNLPEGIEEFVESLLEKDPIRRPPSADAARVTCQRLVKRMAAEATVVRHLEPKLLPTMRLDRPTMPTAGAGAPVADPVHDTTPTTPTTHQSLDRAFPKRSVWPVVVVLLLLVLFGATAFVVSERPGPRKQLASAPAAPVVVPHVPAPAPAPVVEAPSVAKPEVVPADEEITPLSAVPAAVEKRPTVVKVKSAEGSSRCAPDANWKASVKRDLQEIETRAARDPRIQTEYDKVEKQVTRYLQAQTPNECGDVQRPLEQLKEKIRILAKAQ